MGDSYELRNYIVKKTMAVEEIRNLIQDLYLSEDENDDDDMFFDSNEGRQLWDSLRWPGGPYFPDDKLVSSNVRLINVYTGSKYLLSPLAERLARLFVSSPLKDDPVFKSNFWNDFRTYLPPNDFTSLQDIDWSEINNIPEKDEHVDVYKIKADHGFIILNEDERVSINRYAVKRAEIIEKGGYRGRIFPPLRPDKVVLNQSRDEDGGVFQTTEDKFDNWLAKWKNPVTGLTEFIRFDIPEDSDGESGEESDVDDEISDDDAGEFDDDDAGEFDDDAGEFDDDAGEFDDDAGGFDDGGWKRKTKEDEIENVVDFSVLTSEEKYLPLFYLRPLPEQEEILRKAYVSEFKVVADLDKVMDNVLTDYISQNVPKDDPLRVPFVKYAKQRGLKGFDFSFY